MITTETESCNAMQCERMGRGQTNDQHDNKNDLLAEFHSKAFSTIHQYGIRNAIISHGRQAIVIAHVDPFRSL